MSFFGENLFPRKLWNLFVAYRRDDESGKGAGDDLGEFWQRIGIGGTFAYAGVAARRDIVSRGPRKKQLTCAPLQM